MATATTQIIQPPYKNIIGRTSFQFFSSNQLTLPTNSKTINHCVHKLKPPKYYSSNTTMMTTISAPQNLGPNSQYKYYHNQHIHMVEQLSYIPHVARTHH